MKKTLIAIIIILTILISPKVNAKIIKIQEDPITEYSQDLNGKIIKYGTPIQIDFPYQISYNNNYYLHITDFTSNNNQTNQNVYVGLNDDNMDLSINSKYWIIADSRQYASAIILMFAPYTGHKKNCILENLEEGDICYKDMIFDSSWAVKIYYYDRNDNEIGSKWYLPYGFAGYEEMLIGYTESGLIENTNSWEYIGIISQASSLVIGFKETDRIEEKNERFNLTCDKDRINYKDKTICHFKANDYQISTDPIIVTLEEKDDLELINITPGDYFSVDNDNNLITITPRYISTTQENVELFSFEIKAQKEKNEIDNVSIKNINYYNNKTYTDLKTTININNNSPLLVNPLTERQSLILKLLLIGTLLVISTKLLLKKKVYE